MTITKTITKQMMVDAEACYTEEQLDEILEDGKDLSVEEVTKLDIPVQDRCWALSAVMTPEMNRRCARRIALDVIHLWDAPDIVKQYLNTGDESLRDAACAASRDASWAASRDAACAASRAAARAASRAASWAASRAASWAAAWDASRAASRDAAGEKHLSWMADELLRG